jgi:hypothetical protein
LNPAERPRVTTPFGFHSTASEVAAGIDLSGKRMIFTGAGGGADRDPMGDALHLALASYHNCEFLVTWNCQHLANANKYGHIRRVNNLLGLYVPVLATPLELLGETYERGT